ncbi:MAG: hypothetical protein HYY16_06105 [Planctomycetes bacterium]|nr:hypothetical protein [Planctomycetota bacterium]
MNLLLFGITLLVAGGSAALLARRSSWLGAGSAVLGCAAGLIGAVRALAAGASESWRLAWEIPGGSFAVELDALSAFFLIPILGLSALAAIYGVGYLDSWRGKKALGPVWFFTNTLIASMAMVVIARNGLLFLVAWEVMALASFFLVGFEHEKPAVREAAWVYFVAGHFGTAFLIVFFLLLGREAGSLDFEGFDRVAPAMSAPLFLMALVGFGTKAGFMPLHVWLPDAHPAAPSHVSALMSGVMIKTGIYGLVRALTFLGAPPPWWGWTLIGVGLVSGVLGVLFALAQHDLKRLLAYHSVENIGIIALGAGVGVLGQAAGSPALAFFGWAGALLHVVNHALFKGLLFLGAGSVLHATGTREMDHLGGLLKRMPVTGVTFLIGAAAISGLPPLNGFVSEFLILLGAFSGACSKSASTAVPVLVTIGGLALISGLAAACFTKAFGVVFLGEPRGEHAHHAHEAGLAMRIPMVLLAAACFAVGLLAPAVLRFMAPAVKQVSGVDFAGSPSSRPAIAWGAAAFLTVVGGLALVRRRLLAGRTVGETVTWDCGYARPGPRMQYTSSSFAQPLTDLFATFLRTRRTQSPPSGYFPRNASYATETPDVCREGLFRNAFLGGAWVLGKLGWLQQGRVHLYVLYIALTLLALLMWSLR